MTATVASPRAAIVVSGTRLLVLPQLALCVLAASIGFGDIAQTNPFTTGVLSGVHALLPLAVALTVASAALTRQWPRYPAALAIPTGIWLTVLVASAVLAPSHRSDALATLDRPFSSVLLACAVIFVCHDGSVWVRVLQALALGGLGIAIIGLAEASGAQPVLDALGALHDGAIPIGDIPRVAATLSHPNETAMLLELCLPLLIAWAWTARDRLRLPLMLACIATLACIVLTFSRAGTATALLCLALLALVALRYRRPRHAIAIGLLALVVPVALAWTAVVDDGLDRRLLAGLDESSAVQPSRTEFWSVAVEMAGSNPLLGVGPDNFRWLFASYSGVDADNLGIHAHNQYLEAFADTGLLGALSLVWLLAALAFHCVRALSRGGPDWPWRAALLAATSAWLMHALLDDFERFWPTSVAFWLIAGLSARSASD
ncbi:MAG: O-antigen ligase family protein [Chloroflexi bacterium]|nr:O-antigen ligase family protein [Chloroflexota bacterium]